MLKQNKLAVAVTVALGASVGAMSTAQAESSLFFPHVVGGGGVTSIVTVINANVEDGDISNGTLHLRLWSKPWSSAADNTTACGELNQYPATSLNDIATFDLFNGGQGGVGKAFGDAKGVMFENKTNPIVDYSLRASYAVGSSLALSQRGFLLVDNETKDGTSVSNEGFLEGEMLILEYGSGASWGYLPYGNSRPVVNGAAANGTVYNDSLFDFSVDAQGNELAGGLLLPDSANPTEAFQGTIGIMPFDEVSTNLMVTPVGLSRDQNTGQLTTRIYPVNGDGIGWYDRDEGAVSTTRRALVTCVGKVNLADLLYGGINNVPKEYIDGGWTEVFTDDAIGQTTWIDPRVETVQAVVYKLEYDTGATFNGVPVDGTFNNAYEMDGGWHTSGEVAVP